MYCKVLILLLIVDALCRGLLFQERLSKKESGLGVLRQVAVTTIVLLVLSCSKEPAGQG